MTYIEVSNTLSFETIYGLAKSHFPHCYIQHLSTDNLHTKFNIDNLNNYEVFKLGYILGKYEKQIHN